MLKQNHQNNLEIEKEKPKIIGELKMRFPNSKDAKNLCIYDNNLSKEKTFILYQGEAITLKEEEEYLAKLEKVIKENRGAATIATIDNEVVGFGAIIVKPKIYSHIANVSISVAKKYRGQGLGKKIMENLLNMATGLKGVKILTLQVHSNNKVALNLYRKLGFKKYGLLPRGLKYHGKYVDEILMEKELF